MAYLATLLTSSTSASSSDAVARTSQSCALISEVLEFSKLNTAPYPLSTEKFARYLREQYIAPSLLMKGVETFKDTSPANSVVKASLGILGHQFNVVTIRLPGDRETHIRVDYWALPPPGSDSRLVVSLSDDRDSLVEHCTPISRISSASPAASDIATTHSPPALSILAELLIVAHGRLAMRPYSAFSYNCMWMADMLFYTLALRHAEHWPTGSQTPQAPIQLYLRGETGALETAVSCSTLNETAQWWVGWAGKAVCAIQVAVTQESGQGRYMMHDTEVSRCWTTPRRLAREDGDWCGAFC